MTAERWCWLGPVGAVPDGAIAAAEAVDLGGGPTVLLAAWPATQRRRPGAGQVDRRVIAADGPAMAVSYATPGRGVRVLFDDPAVVAATRAALTAPGRAFVSTLVQDAAHIAGAVTGIEASTADGYPDWWAEDPFARVFPARRMLVRAGLFRRVPPPVGPVHQRYGGVPWPVAGFSDS